VGYVTASPARKYYCGDVVTIEAVPSACCYFFDHWEGDVADKWQRVTTVTVDATKSVTAVFKDWRTPGTTGMTVYYAGPRGWTADGYWEDTFHAELTNAEFASMDWTDVLVRERLCYISDDLPDGGLKPHEISRFVGSSTGEFYVRNVPVMVVENGEFVERTATWIVGEFSGEFLADGHGISARAYETLQNHFATAAPTDVREIYYRQQYYIADWGSNDPNSYSTDVIGETDIVLRLNRIVVDGACYTSAEYVCHVRADKGGEHHPCAWYEFPQGRDRDDTLACPEDCP